jgi:hypothetical protein
MSNAVSQVRMRITRPAEGRIRIACVVDVPPDDFAKLSHDQTPSLVMDPFRPTVVGWRWAPPQGFGPETLANSHSPATPDLTDQHWIGFFYAVPSTEEADAFFPTGESIYNVVAELDLESGTIWFPLPPGRSLHMLQAALQDFHVESLVDFVGGWFVDKHPDYEYPFEVDFGLSFPYDDVVSIACPSSTTDLYDSTDIPAELLRDPIRNGSEDLRHGFNPWNEDQKTRIVAHMERELIRLTEFFQRDSSSRSSVIPSG